MDKKEIDKMCKKFKRGELSKAQVKKLALAIKANPKTKEIALTGALSKGDFKTAFNLL